MSAATTATSAKPGYINTIVLQDIADPTGALYTSYLDVLAPYLPGGATPAFTRAYVGTVDLAWTGRRLEVPRGHRESGVPEPERHEVPRRRECVPRPLSQVVNSWYITYEANLAGFWDANLAAAYRSYLVQVTKAFAQVVAKRAVLWSPAFWTMYADEPAWALPGLRRICRGCSPGCPRASR